MQGQRPNDYWSSGCQPKTAAREKRRRDWEDVNSSGGAPTWSSKRNKTKASDLCNTKIDLCFSLLSNDLFCVRERVICKALTQLLFSFLVSWDIYVNAYSVDEFSIKSCLCHPQTVCDVYLPIFEPSINLYLKYQDIELRLPGLQSTDYLILKN